MDLYETVCLNSITAGNEMNGNDCDDLNFNIFKFTDHNVNDFEQDIDPENNFFNNLNNNCGHYSEGQFYMNIKSVKGMSIIDFNSRMVPI